MKDGKWSIHLGFADKWAVSAVGLWSPSLPLLNAHTYFIAVTLYGVKVIPGPTNLTFELGKIQGM